MIHQNASGKEARKTNKLTMAWAALLIAVLVAGGVATLAFLTDTTDTITNIYSKSAKYTLAYHANTRDADEDARVSVPASQESYGTSSFTISSDIPVRDNYVFTGWYLSEDGSGDKIDPGSTYTATNRHTDLYAQWEIGYTVEYDANGGENPPAADTRTSSNNSETFNIKGPGSMVYKMTVGGQETTEAKVFLGWSADKNATEPEYTSDGKYAYTGADFDGDTSRDDFDKTITLQDTNRKVTLYAVWATRYKLIFDANAKYNGTGNVPPTQTRVSTKDEWEFKIIENNEDNDDPAITPTRTDSAKGYRFGWWCDNPDSRDDGPGTYQYGEPVTVFSETTERFRQDPWRVLYAVYKPPRTLGLYYNANGGRGDFQVYWGSVLTERQLVDIDPNPDLAEDKKDPTRTNYVFMGWSKDQNAKTADYQTGDQILIDIWEDSAPTLYAVWRTQHKFGVHFYLNGGTYVRYKNNSGNWTYSGSTGYWESPYLNDKDTIVTEYHGFDAEFFSTHGIYATRNNDATSSYEFLGWSYNKNNKALSELTEEDVDISVELPSDPNNPAGTATGTQGCITEEIPVYDKDGDSCTTPRTHWTDLYAVWKRTPLHSFKILFTNKDVPNNRNMTGVSIVNRVNNSTINESEAGSTASPIVSVKNADIRSTSYVYGKKFEKNSLPIATNPYAVWTVDEICTSSLIPSATKAATATERYEFAGWSYGRSGKSPNELTTSDIDVAVDESTGKITAPIRIDDPNPDTCEGDIHYLLLFPVFKTIPQHTFNLYFVPNYTTLSGYTKNMQYKWVNNGSWYSISNSGSSEPLDPNAVFDTFYKKSENANSSGLGLAIAKAICNRYGFSINYQFIDNQHFFTIKTK